MSRKMKIPVVLGLAGVAIAWLAATGVSRNDVWMTTLDQWDAARARRAEVRVMGFVKDGSISEERDRLVTSFTLRNEAGGVTLPMRFVGVTPDLFRDGASVIATGRLGDDGTFVARDLMTKCPSKYEGVETPHGQAPAYGEPPEAGAPAPPQGMPSAATTAAGLTTR